VSVLELVAALREAAGGAADGFEPEFAEARTGELQRSALDVSRARAELGFSAEVGLVEGMRRTLDAVRAEIAG
jgi:UDP-glucose 4-epimerase